MNTAEHVPVGWAEWFSCGDELVSVGRTVSQLRCHDLLAVANRCNIPNEQEFPHDNGNYDFATDDGWKVKVFYDSGYIDYIDCITAPNGEVIDVYGGRVRFCDDPNWLRLLAYDPDQERRA